MPVDEGGVDEAPESKAEKRPCTTNGTSRSDSRTGRPRKRSQFLLCSTAPRCCWRLAGIDRNQAQGSCKRLLALQLAGSSYCRNLRENIESESAPAPRGSAPCIQT